MRPMLSSDPFVKRLILALGLPASVRSFELSAGVDQAVAVKCEYYADADLAAGLDPKPLLAEYRLVKSSEIPLRSGENVDLRVFVDRVKSAVASDLTPAAAVSMAMERAYGRKPVVPQPRSARGTGPALAVTAAAVCLAPLLVLLAAWLAGR